MRPASGVDLPFLRYLYATTRAAEVAATAWPAPLAEAFLTDQFRLQHRHYVENGLATDFWVIEKKSAPIGRLYLDRSGATWRIVDLAILPEHQNQGFGAALLKAIQTEARASNITGVDLHVLRTNGRAAALYRRLGFVRALDESATHLRMVWSVS